MTKEKLGNELSYTRVGYKTDRWKWVVDLPKQIADRNGGLDSNSTTGALDVFPSAEQLREIDLIKCYGLDKVPKTLPCLKRCSQNPWCLGGLKAGSATGKAGSRVPLHQQKRTDFKTPVGLQNTANTCWINSALQLFYHLRKFRNALNSVDDFTGEESLDSFVHLLQIIFAEMESHPFKAMACEPGSVLEKLGMFASREVMKKDANNELLKCVSEFMENTIDLLLADHRLASLVAPLFTITLTRVARWQCSKCARVHEYELSPASSYTMGAYISADQAPLQQCLMDLQAETQTGVLMVCGGRRRSEGGGTDEGGCGAEVKVDRVVTPKLGTLPTYLIIRNNSLIAEDVKRRLHVVYPERLDLSSHTLDGGAALYQLCGVVFHHGYWVKHYSAQVRTDGGSWFSFNDATVMEMNFKSAAASQCNPQENHPNYFSLGSVSAKFKGRGGERVSRGAFIWLYTLVEDSPSPPLCPPPSSISQFVDLRRSLHKEDKSKELMQVQAERQTLLRELAFSNTDEPYALLSESLLLAWLSSQECQFVAQPLLLWPHLRCEHGYVKPLLAHALKCVRACAVEQLLTHCCGIHASPQLKNCARIENITKKEAEFNCTSSSPSVNGIVQKASSNATTTKSVSSNIDACIASDLQSNASDKIIEQNQHIPNTKLEPSCNHAVSSESLPQKHEVEVENDTSGSVEAKVEHKDIPGVTRARQLSRSETEAKDDIPGVVGAERPDIEGAMKALQIFPGTQHQCRECVARHARHILFLERLRVLHKLCKKEALRQYKEHYRAVGAQSLDLWPKLAARRYVKMNCIDMAEDMSPTATEEEGINDRIAQPDDAVGAEAPSAVADAISSTVPDDSQPAVDGQSSQADSSSGFQLFNEDLVCNHHQLNTQAAKFYLPPAMYDRIVTLVGEDIHPVTALDDFQPCLDCQNVLDATESACERGIAEKNSLPSLFADKKRPSFTKDAGSSVYILDRDVFDEWRAFVRGCVRGVADVRPKLSNEELLCEHKKLCYNPLLLDPMRCSRLWVLVWPDEWSALEQLYGQPNGSSIRATVSPAGLVDIIPGVCERGCVESRAEADYEDQFVYEGELIYVRQVHSENDIPLRAVVSTRSMGPAPATIASIPSPHLKSKSSSGATSTSSDKLDGKSLSKEVTNHSLGGNVVIAAAHSQEHARKKQNGSCDKQTIYSRLASGLGNPSVCLNGRIDEHLDCSSARLLSGDSEKRSLDDADVSQDCISPTPSKQAKLDQTTTDSTSSSEPASSSSQTPAVSASSVGGACSAISTLNHVSSSSVQPPATPHITDFVAPSCTTAATVRQSSRRRAPRPSGPSPQEGRNSKLSKTATAKLVRASKAFSSTDTVRQVQNFIAERTGVWPMLQTVWLVWSEDLAAALSLPPGAPAPVLLADHHLTMTLGALRILPGDTIYFKAAKEDMEMAAGDGMVEFGELPV